MRRAAVSARLARLVRQRAGDRCEYCQLPQQWQESTFHIDHVRPRFARGRSLVENLALACVGCSLKKGAQTSRTDPASGEAVRLFNPRLDEWKEHFTWDGHWRIVGLSPIGRATVIALDLNRIRLVEIRRDLALLGRYPPQ